MEYSTNSQFKYLGKPILILLAIISLFSFTVFFGIGRLKKLNQKTNEAKVLNSQLSQKIDILKNVKESVEKNVNFVDIALPSKGVSLFGINQIKNKANSLGLTIQNLKTTGSTSETKNIEKTSISFDIEGDRSTLDQFFGSFENVLPLANIEKLSITETEGLFSASVNINFYSSEALKKIPAITGQVSTLTDEELEILNSLSSYEMPSFSVPEASEYPIREDIFN